MDFFHTLPLLKKAEIFGLEDDPFYRILCEAQVGNKKRPFTPSQVVMIYEKLCEQKRLRDVVLFSLGIDLMARCSDTLKIRVSDVKDSEGGIVKFVSITQKKTKNQTGNLIMPSTRKLLKHYIEQEHLDYSDYLFPGREEGTHLCGRQYRHLVKDFAKLAGLPPEYYSTHSMRRTKAVIMYALSKDSALVRHSLGQKSLSSTQDYLGVEQAHALSLAGQIDILGLDY